MVTVPDCGSQLNVDCVDKGMEQVGSDRDPVTGLSEEDRTAIRDSWTLVNKDAQGNGVAFMLRFFEEYPDNQEFFTEFRDLSPDELRENQGLQQHAMRVMRALTCIVESIDDAHVLISVLHKTVDSHLTRGIRVAQFTELFDVFARFIADGLGDQFTPAMATAWQTAAAAILTVVEARVQEQLIATSSEAS
nr:hypothetical protein BaRGS_025886 [Batillaria attramentaria]